MDRSITAASFQSFISLSNVIVILIYDRNFFLIIEQELWKEFIYLSKSFFIIMPLQKKFFTKKKITIFGH